MNESQLRYINQTILNQASKLNYIVSDSAPNNEIDLFNSSTLVIWSGASDNTIFQDKRVNWAFRALHDTLHLKTGLSFSPADEVKLGYIQANQYQCPLMRELIIAEVALQAEYYQNNGVFVPDQKAFTLKHLKLKGI